MEQLQLHQIPQEDALLGLWLTLGQRAFPCDGWTEPWDTVHNWRAAARDFFARGRTGYCELYFTGNYKVTLFVDDEGQYRVWFTAGRKVEKFLCDPPEFLHRLAEEA